MRRSKMEQGAISELTVCAWLLKQGYEVYRNVSFFGKVDIVAYKDGEYFAFDVKTARRHRPKLKAAQLRRGIRPLYVLADETVVHESPPKEPTLIEKVCKGCGKPFQSKFEIRYTKLFCTQSCRRSYHYKCGKLAP